MTDLCREISELGKGIGNEKRYRILETLMNGPLAVRAIAEQVALPQPAVSQHLKVLKAARLVTDTRFGQEVRYAVNVSYMAKLLQKLTVDLSKKHAKAKEH